MGDAGTPAPSAGSSGFQRSGSLKADIKAVRRGDFEGDGKNLPTAKALTEPEQIAFCKASVPGWSALPDTVKVSVKKFAAGVSSCVCKVSLEGPGSERIQPSVCVYRYMKLEDKDPCTMQYNENFVVSTGEAGSTEKIFAANGPHRCTEFCKGREAFGGESAHFLGAMYLGITPPMSDDNSPGNCELMGALGKALGTIHGMGWNWISSVLGEEEFAKRKADPWYWPTFVLDPKFAMSEKTRSRAIACTPQTGWFAEPVPLHTDLHGANIFKLDADVGGGLRIIDWEGLCIGYRGFDLAYLFLNCPGSTLKSRRAFVREYMSSQQHAVGEKDIDGCLIDIEKCTPLALAANVTMNIVFARINRYPLMKVMEKVLKILETTVVDKTCDEILMNSKWVIEEGVVQRALSEVVSTFCCSVL
jgi:hypothetical protein